MSKIRKNFSLVILLLIGFSFTNQLFAQESDSTIVERYGQLRVEGIHIVNQNGEPIVLRGMSNFWSQWSEGSKYYNADCVEWLRDDWKITVIRPAMGIEMGGYLTDPVTQMNRIKTVIDAAIDLGIYVIVDWHDHNAEDHLDKAVEFFTQIATQYGEYPNVLYEIYNEPLSDVTWLDDVKPYADSVVSAIRTVDPDNIIIVGSPNWSQDVDVAALNPINDDNVAYSLHYYAATHKQFLRNKAVTAMNRGIALFVTEFGTCESSGDGTIDYTESNTWFDFLEEYKIGWCNWSISDKPETASTLLPGADASGGWNEESISPSGLFIRERLRTEFENMFSALKDINEIETGYSLKQNYPNPFNPTTIISYSIPQNSDVQLSVYSLLGERVASLFNGYEVAGNHEIAFSASDLPSGVYMYQLHINNFTEIRKMLLLK